MLGKITATITFGFHFFVAYFSVQFAIDFFEYVTSDENVRYFPKNVVLMYVLMAVSSIGLFYYGLAKNSVRTSIIQVFPVAVTIVTVCTMLGFLVSGHMALD